MSDKKTNLSRRAFLGRTAALAAVPYIVPASVFGRDGAVPPSERIVLGGIGIGNRGTQRPATGCCRKRTCNSSRPATRRSSDAKRSRQHGGHPLRQQRLPVVRRHPRVPGHADGYRRGPEHHRRPLACAGRHHGHAGGQGRVFREALGHDDRRRPGRRGNRPALPADLPVRHPAAQRGELHVRQRAASARLPRQRPHRPAHIAPWDAAEMRHDWLPEQPLPPKEEMDWDAWLGPCPWRPYNVAYTQGQWRNHYDFHTSCIGEWGAHTFAQCQVALGLWENLARGVQVRQQRQRRRHGDDLRQRRQDGP